MKKVLKVTGVSVGILVIGCLLFGFVLIRTGFKAVEYDPFGLPEQSATTWQEVFEHPASITVIPFKMGVMRMDRYPDSPPQAKDRYKPSDILAYAIRHERYGDMLIDTGWDRSFSENPPFGNYPLLVKILLRMKNDQLFQTKGHDIASLMVFHHIKPKRVFFTHLHVDHTAGIPALPDGIEYVFDARELNFIGKATLNYYLPGKRRLKTLDFSAAKEVPPLGRCLDVLGDGSMWAVSTPGHSSGHVSYVINAKAGPALVTGDAAFYQWGFAQGVGNTRFDEDTKAAGQSRAQLLAFSRQYSQVKVFFGHELVK